MRRPTAAAAGRGRRRRVAAAAAAGALVIGLAAACNDDNDNGEDVIDDPPTSDTTPASTQPTAEPKTPREKAIEAAEQAIRDYRAADYRLASKPHQAVSDRELREIAMADGYFDIYRDWSYYRRNGYRAIGQPQIVDMIVRSVKLTHKPNRQPPVIPTVLIEICNDVKGTNTVDRTGHSVVDPSRPDRFAMTYWVSNSDWPDQDGWKVSDTETELKPCTK